MKLNLKALVAGAVTLATAGAGFAAMAAPASATPTVPPWEPDANAGAPYANVVFFDANGNQVTSGSNDLTNPFAWAVATTGADAASTKAQLIFSKPQFASPPNPALWGGVAEGGPTVFNPSVSGAPASVSAFAPNYPVVKSAANISSFASSQGTDPTAGYTDIIQVRVQDTAQFGTPSYWDTDIAYNTTSSPTTIDGVTVPANGWAQIFPNVTPTTTSLTTSAASLTPGNPITLTATVPSADAGSVYFYDGTTLLSSSAQSGGSATYTYTPTQGNHSYRASFVPGPTPGDETGANTSSANIVSGSVSPAVAVSDNPPATHVSTNTALSESSTATNPPPTNLDTETLTATVTETTNAPTGDTTGLTGTVQFYDGSAALGSPVNTTISGTSATAAYSTKLSAGSHSITAVYTPNTSDNSATIIYDPSTSQAVSVTIAQSGPCAQTGSNCGPDKQNIQVTVNPGSITLSTPYTSGTPYTLPAMSLSSDATFLQTSGAFPAAGDPQITITSTLSPAYSWTLSVAATPLTSSTTDTPIAASGLGLTNVHLENVTGTGAYPGTITKTDIAALNPSPNTADSAGTGPGLSGTAQQVAQSSAVDGTAQLGGTLTLLAPTSTKAGTYNGVLTFSVS